MKYQRLCPKNFVNTYFADHILVDASETSMILILFLKFGKFEHCHFYKLYFYKKVYMTTLISWICKENFTKIKYNLETENLLQIYLKS